MKVFCLVLERLPLIRKRVILKSKFQTEGLILFKNRAVVFTSVCGVTAVLGSGSACGHVKPSLPDFLGYNSCSSSLQKRLAVKYCT